LVQYAQGTLVPLVAERLPLDEERLRGGVAIFEEGGEPPALGPSLDSDERAEKDARALACASPVGESALGIEPLAPAAGGDAFEKQR
jgi:hypothetical protein